MEETVAAVITVAAAFFLFVIFAWYHNYKNMKLRKLQIREATASFRKENMT